MLQQTTVTTVTPRFKQWLKTYPNIKKLAQAKDEEVVRAWEGLGYYSRARNLHAAAREIVESYGGKVPDEPQQLKKLPGIGDYTAAAVASIAYGVRVPALDANNIRVWSRLLATGDRKRIARVFARIISLDRPGDFNQALMDLGATVCTPKNPLCHECPLSTWCRALRLDQVEQFPVKKSRPETTRIEAALGIIILDDKVLVQKRPAEGLLGGMWEFPGGKIRGTVRACVRESVSAKKLRTKQNRSYASTLYEHTDTLVLPVSECVRESVRAKEQRAKQGRPYAPTLNGRTDTRELPEEAVIREVREETGLRIQVCEKLGVFTHTYTRFRVKLHVFICKRKAGKLTNSEARWVTLEELEALPMPSANRRIVGALEKHLDTETRGHGDAETRRRGEQVKNQLRGKD